MAVTSEITTTMPSSRLPTGFTVPSVSALASPASEVFTVDVDRTTVEDADAATGLTALLAAVKSEFDTTIIPNTLKLDELETIVAVIEVSQVQPAYSAFEVTDHANIYKTATVLLRCTCTIKWE